MIKGNPNILYGGLIMGFGIWNMQQKLTGNNIFAGKITGIFRKDKTRYRVGKIVNFLVSQLELRDINTKGWRLATGFEISMTSL